MNPPRSALLASASLLGLVVLAGCTGNIGGNLDATLTGGTVMFCVQDDNTVNFTGVFVNFGNIQINQGTSGTNNQQQNVNNGGTQNVNNGASGGATTGASSSPPTSTTTYATTSTATTTSYVPTTATTTTHAPATSTAATTYASAQPVDASSQQCDEVVQGGGANKFFVHGEQNYGAENPGSVADEQRGASDSPCDRDQGFGNDAKASCTTIKPKHEDNHVNLKDFQGNRAALVAQEEVPAGTFCDLVIHINDVQVTTSDGRTIRADLEGSQIVLHGCFTVVKGQHTLVMFKVDLERSLRSTSEDHVVFQPVIVVKASAPQTVKITVHATQTVTMTATATQTVTTTATPTNSTSNPATTSTAATPTSSSTNATATPTPATTSPTPT